MWLLVLIAVAAVLLARHWKICNYWKAKDVPHLKPIPFFGNFLPTVLRRKSVIDVATEAYYLSPNSR